MILKKAAGVFVAAAVACGLALPDIAAPAQPGVEPRLCDAGLATLFTPNRPLMGRYEVCTDSRSLSQVEPTWTVALLEASDAFGGAGSIDRAALTRLYRGRRAEVARGWTAGSSRVESITLI